MTFNEKYKDNALLLKTFNFALNIIDYTCELQEQKKFVIANQLLKSGTSIGANSKESQNAESKADFIHKLKIAIKEADETEYWLFLCDTHKSFPSCRQLLNDLSEILKILNKIISTSKRN
ncbi:four helix bundle protein [Flavobacterium aquidurense]|uniref:Four helix bundle protein n=1 Tax=Flavobacterium frigidimaris TaxID=262320 RepID=A0ABX4BTW8_FLAFR|nr:four helix bundle protein [Flavobacterium frigidimaris]OXA81202.1 four helix bundle protein [Flavobacterium frigidimaris]SDZ45903.1 four helix bundle protein [Flavobacterium aquidurense]